MGNVPKSEILCISCYTHGSIMSELYEIEY